jgi:hypothetical protein
MRAVRVGPYPVRLHVGPTLSQNFPPALVTRQLELRTSLAIASDKRQQVIS